MVAAMVNLQTKNRAADSPNGELESTRAVTKKRSPIELPIAPKKRKTAPAAKPIGQKNTLDSWFGVKKKAPVKEVKTVDESSGSDGENVERPPQASPLKKTREHDASPSTLKHKAKKLTQRRILLGDQCRVCDSAKTETSTRCERKCMECEMTVHMTCYGVDEDEETPPETWRCRPCQANHNLTIEQPEGEGESGDEEVVRGIPVHEIRGESNRFHGLYHSSEFASVFLFLMRFRRLGLKLGAEVTLETLASAMLSPRDTAILQELHTKLLQNLGVTLSKTNNWVENLVRFFKGGEYSAGAELVSRLASIGNEDDWLSTYCDVPAVDRVALLKLLCEAQFDENDTLVEKIGHDDTTPESLRDEPLGVDAMKRTYYVLEDPPTFTDGSAWLCRCHGHDGSKWETVSDNLTSLQSFTTALSYSSETADLQLWQTIANGVLKSLERREKKRLIQAQRIARMPRMLGTSGLDTASILPEGGRSSGRSLRARRAVNYRSYVDGSSDEDEESEADDDDDDNNDDDDEEEDGGGEFSNGRPTRSSRRLPEEQPTRVSSRLRGGRQSQVASGSESDADVRHDHDEDDRRR